MESDHNEPTNPDRPESWKNAGDEDFLKGAYGSAVEKYIRAIELSPDYLDAWNNLGFTLRKLGKDQEARRCNEKVIELKKQHAQKADAGMPRKSPKPVHKKKEPLLAAIFSVIPGFGQVYCGQVLKGILFLILTIIGLSLFIIPGLLIWIYAIYDAYKISKRMNAGTIPWKDSKPMSMAGFIAAIVIGGILLFTIFQVPLTIARADNLNRNGIQKLNSIELEEGLSSLSKVESARNDFIQAHDILSSVHDPSNPDRHDVQSMLWVTEILINLSDVSGSGVKAFYHQSRMASSINSFDWAAAREENQLAKIEFEKIYAAVQQISTTLTTLEQTSDTSGSADIVREVKRISDPLNTPDYIRLTEAYEHYIAAREYNKQVGNYVSYEKGVFDKASVDYYMGLSRDEERKALEIAESLMDSPVPKVAENAINLARHCEVSLNG